MEKTPREIRENLIMQWYEKKLNRDELLNVLEWNTIIDAKKKKEIKTAIISEFYENFEKEKENTEFKDAENLYMGIKMSKREIDKKTKELWKLKESKKQELNEIDSAFFEIAKNAMSLDEGWLLKRIKFKKMDEKRNELQKQQKKINGDIYKLQAEKEVLLAELKKHEGIYWPKINRPQIKVKGLDYNKLIDEVKKESTLKWYKDKYAQIIKDKKEYMEKFVAEIENIDLGISENKKKEIVELLKISIAKEIELMKEWDEITKIAEETEKRLEENWWAVMEKIEELEKDIEKKEIEIIDIVERWRFAKADEILKIKEEEFQMRKELLKIEDECKALKTEFEWKIIDYDGSIIDWTKDKSFKTRDEWKKR